MPDIIGEPLDNYVIEQIKIRQKLHGSIDRTPVELQILNSNTSWLKLASAVSVSEERLREINLSDPVNLSGYNLAKSYILSSGISRLEKNGTLIQRQGLIPEDTGFSSAYTYGQYGYSPMPGLISADIKNLNRGSIKKATVRLVAHNTEQFHIIDLLYLRLGYTVLLEWGNSIYAENGTDPINKGVVRQTILEKHFYKQNDFRKVLTLINEERNTYDGNYDGLLAKVSNFSWEFKEDGSYDIELTLISLGDVVESLKTNISPSIGLTQFVKGTQIIINSSVSSPTPTTDESTSEANPVEDNKSTSLIHSMLYIWKWLDDVNHRPGNTTPPTPGYITFDLDPTTPQQEGYFLSNQLASNLSSNPGSFNLQVTSYDIWIQVTTNVFWDGKDQAIWRRDNGGAQAVMNFNNAQKWSGTYGAFKFVDYPMITINYDNPVDSFGFTWRGGAYSFSRIIVKQNAFAINNIDLSIPNILRDTYGKTVYEEIKFKYPNNNGFLKSKNDEYNFPNTNVIVFPYSSGSTYPELKSSDTYQDGSKLIWGYRDSNMINAQAYTPDGNVFPLKPWSNGLPGDTPTADVPYEFRDTGLQVIHDTSGDAARVYAYVTYPTDINDYAKPSTTPNSFIDVTIDNPIKDAEPYDAFKLDLKVPQYYIKLNYLLKYIKKNILPRVKLSSTHDDNPPIFDIQIDEAGKKPNIMFAICDSQISFDPKVCIVRNDKYLNSLKVATNLNTWTANDDPYWDTNLADKNFSARTMNIYLNFDFIIESLSEDQYGNINMYDFLSNICTGINKALGGVNNLEPVIDENTNILRILDTTPIPGTVRNTSSKHKDYKLQLYGYKNKSAISNFVRKLSLKTAITPEFATMVTVGATAGGYTKGVEATAFSKWNNGLVDRYKTQFTPGNKETAEAATSGSGVDEAVTNWDNRLVNPPQPINRYGFGSFTEKNEEDGSTTSGDELKDDIINGNLSVAVEYLKYYMAKESGPSGGGMIGFIPFKMSLTLDGLSGIKIYNKLTVDTSFLPSAYKDKLDLIVTGVTHKVSDQDWVTDIETTVIPNSNPQKSSRTFTPTNILNNAPNNRGGGSGGGSVVGKVNNCKEIPPSSAKKNIVKASDNTDAKAIGNVINYLEGGYFHPTHAWNSNGTFKTKFDYRTPSNPTSGNSGETLWGIDRPNGDSENDPTPNIKSAGIKFWGEVDRLSGFGRYKLQNQTIKKYDWDIKKYPKLPNAWEWLHNPGFTPGTVLADNAQIIIKRGFERNMNSSTIGFGPHPLNQIVRNDGRLLFMYYRAWWNGSGFFQAFAKNLKQKYDSGMTDIDDLICADLTRRYNYLTDGYWKKGISKMKDLIDFNKK